MVKLGQHTMGSEKVPGMVVFHCNGKTYGNAYLTTFTHTLVPPILPLLEALVEGFFWNFP
jgi:hypothetical protein